MSAEDEALDVHGIDDAGTYHPPSRARYLEIYARLEAMGRTLGGALRDKHHAIDNLTHVQEAATRSKLREQALAVEVARLKADLAHLKAEYAEAVHQVLRAR